MIIIIIIIGNKITTIGKSVERDESVYRILSEYSNMVQKGGNDWGERWSTKNCAND